jgi:hypothetical protein
LHGLGRLIEQHKALSKDELLTMIRFGADTIFNTNKEVQELTDEDIDAIIERGQKLTAEVYLLSFVFLIFNPSPTVCCGSSETSM